VTVNEKHYFFKKLNLMSNQKSKEMAHPSEKTEKRGELRRRMGVGSALPASYISLGQRPHPPVHLSTGFLIAISSPHLMLGIVFDESLYGSVVGLLYLRWEAARGELPTA